MKQILAAQEEQPQSARTHPFRLGTRARWISLVVVLVGTFTAGWVAAQTPFATQINKGLVNAFNSVGQNLFGSAVFGARVIPPDPIFPTDTVQLDVADDTRIPVVLNAFAPPNPLTPTDPCRTYVQVVVGDGGVRVTVDPDAPEGVLEVSSLAAVTPSPARCNAGPVTVD